MFGLDRLRFLLEYVGLWFVTVWVSKLPKYLNISTLIFPRRIDLVPGLACPKAFSLILRLGDSDSGHIETDINRLLHTFLTLLAPSGYLGF